MIRRVPITRRIDPREARRERVERSEDARAVGHRQRSAGEEVMLRIGDDQRVVRTDRVGHATMLTSLLGTKMRLRTGFPSSCAWTFGSRSASAKASSSLIPGGAATLARTLPLDRE